MSGLASTTPEMSKHGRTTGVEWHGGRNNWSHEFLVGSPEITWDETEIRSTITQLNITHTVRPLPTDRPKSLIAVPSRT